MFIIAVDVSGNALSDTPPSSVNAVAGNEIQDELMLMQPRSVTVRVAKFTYLAFSTSSQPFSFRFMPMPGMGGILDDTDSDYAEVAVVSGRSRGRNRNRSKGKGGGGGGGSRKTNKWRNRGGGHKNRNRVAQG